MALARFQQTLDGQEQQQSDTALFATEAAHVDDHVLAELLRLATYDGTSVAKAVLPYAVAGANGAMVRPNGASGTVLVMPFRFVAGTRVGPGTASTDAVDQTGALLNWRDVRSAVFAVSDNGTSLGHAVAFTANSSGNPRIDLVYATIQIDQNGPNADRFVQPPNAPEPTTATSVVATIIQIVSVGVVTGATGVSPSPPATPADTLGAAGTYNVALALVQIPDGFVGTSTVTTSQILSVAPVARLSAAFGTSTVAPPSGLAASYPAAGIQAWGASGVRPSEQLPSTMVGSERRWFGIDARTASPTLGDTAILDQSIDWRRRTFRVEVTAWPGATQFAWQPSAATGAIPNAGAGGVSSVQRGQSTADDSVAKFGGSSRGAGVVLYVNNANLSPLSAGSNAFGLYVDLSTGALKVFYQGTPGQLLYVELEANAAFDNP